MQRSFKPVISTARVRGLIKKNKISYVDATRRLYPNIASGLSVWQLCDDIYVRAYGKNWQADVEAFNNVLRAYGLTLLNHREDRADAFKIVKAIA